VGQGMEEQRMGRMRGDRTLPRKCKRRLDSRMVDIVAEHFEGVLDQMPPREQDIIGEMAERSRARLGLDWIEVLMLVGSVGHVLAASENGFSFVMAIRLTTSRRGHHSRKGVVATQRGRPEGEK